MRLKDDLSKIDVLYKTEIEKVKGFQLSLNEKDRKLSTLELHLSQAKDISGETRNLLNKINFLSEQEAKLIREKEQLRDQLLKSETVVSNGGRQIERLNLQKNELLQEVKNLRDELFSLKNLSHSEKSRTIQLQERMNINEITISDLKDATMSAEQRAVSAE